MKTVMLILLALLPNAIAQGTVTFNNRGLYGPNGIYDAVVTLPDGTRPAGAAFTSGLYLVGGENSLSLIATTPFREGVAAGFLFPQTVSVPGVLPGSPATFRVRVWEAVAGSYESAVQEGRYYGEFKTGDPNNNVYVPHLESPFGGIDPPALLHGILPLTLVPEAPGISILILGAAILFCSGSRHPAE